MSAQNHEMREASGMEVKLLSPEQWTAARGRLLAFCRRCGEKRLTAAALSALQSLEPEALADAPAGRVRPEAGAAGRPRPLLTAPDRVSRDGRFAVGTAAIAVAVDAGRLVGFAFAADAGERACIVAVHPDTRGKGVGSSLIKALHSRWGRLTCSVAADNPASMQMCFRAGMKAVGLTTGPTGKPTLRFESQP